MSSSVLWAGLALGYAVLAALVWRFLLSKPKAPAKPIPMPPASDEDLQVAAEVLGDAGEREQGVITDAAKDPRAAAALAKLRRGKR